MVKLINLLNKFHKFKNYKRDFKRNQGFYSQVNKNKKSR